MSQHSISPAAIKRAREQRGWTQSQLAHHLSVGQQSVSRWESGKGTPGRNARAGLLRLIGSAAWADDASAQPGEPHAPARPLAPSLPFNRLAPDAFEAFVVEWIQLRHPGVDDIHRCGGPGDRQDGIDVFVRLPDGSTVDYQCKRHQEFGPQKVRAAVGANETEANHHYLVLARDVASTGARKAMSELPNWTLLDGQDISRMIRTRLSPDDAARLVDTYFPTGSFREHFLGLREPGAWMTPEEFYRPFDRRDRAFSHAWTFVGRHRNVDEVVKELLTCRSSAYVISGRGGSGKTRLLKEVAARFAHLSSGQPVRFLSKAALVDLHQIERLPQGEILLVVDDVHERTDIPALLEGVGRLRPGARLLVATRPYAVTRVLGELRRHNAIGFDEPPVLELGDLSSKDVTALAREVLIEHNSSLEEARLGAVASSIAQLTRDCPLLTVVGAAVVALERVSPHILGDKESFRQTIFQAFADAITGSLVEDNGGDNLREILSLISVLQPVRPEDPDFVQVGTTVTGLTEDRLARGIRTLHDAGILLRRGRLIQIVPDLLADYLLADAAIDVRSGTTTRYADHIFRRAGDKYVENLLMNLSKIDWQVSASRGVQTNVLDEIWRDLTARFRRSGILEREALLKGLRRVSLYQPERVLSFVQIAINEPTEELEVDYSILFPELETDDYATVLHELPQLLQGVAYNLKFTQLAVQLLWELGRNDGRPTNSHSNHAVRVLTELAAYEPGKPLSHNEAVTDAALRWLKRPDVGSYLHSPFEVLAPILAAEGQDVVFRGHSVQLNPYFVKPDVVRPLRTKVIDAAFEAIAHADLAVAARAVRFLKDALRGPTGRLGEKPDADDASAWLSDTVTAIERLEETVAAHQLDAVVLDEIVKIVSWQTRHGKDEVRTAARRAIAAVPDSLSYRVTAALTHTWLRVLDESAHGYQDAESVAEERRKSVAAELITNFPTQDVVDIVVGRLDALSSAKVRPSASPGAFIATVCLASPEVTAAFVNQVMQDPANPLSGEFSTILDVVRHRDRSAAAELGDRCLDEGRDDLAREVAEVYGWGLRRGDAPTGAEIELVLRLAGAADSKVLAPLAHAAPSVTAIDHASGIRLLLALLRRGDSEVQDAVFAQFADHGGLSMNDLTEEELSKLETHLVQAPRIDAFHTAEFLGELFLRNPQRVVRLLMRRIDASEKIKSRTAYQPVPLSWDEGSPFRTRETPRLLEVLNDIAEWLRSAPERRSSRRYWGAQLFSAVCGRFDDTVVAFLREMVQSDHSEDLLVIASLVSEAPRTLVRDNPLFVQEILEASWGAGMETYKRVKNALHRSAASGFRSGIPGEPFPEDVEQRDWARDMASRVPIGSPTYQFYDELRRSAEESIRFNLDLDAEELALD